jgi:DNA-binding CsgD family transcriptional regulator
MQVVGQGVVGHEAERAALARFLDLLADGPAILLLEGAPGIGKTTLLRAALVAAEELGCRVLSCTGSSSDARLSYSALADLLHGVDYDEDGSLPAVQRRALDAALLRAGDPKESAAVDAHAVSAAALSVLSRLVANGPVVVAVDDLQWVDAPSRRVIEYSARRLPPGAGLLATRRTEGGGPSAGRLAGLLEPDRWAEVTVSPLPPDEMHRLVRATWSGPFERRLANRIVEVAGGNPLYAVELVQGLLVQGEAASLRLPPSLTEMVRDRLAGLDHRQHEVLLAVAAMGDPSLEVVAGALGPGVLEALAEPERRRLVTVDRDRVVFTHPLLAEGVYAGATEAERRDVHRRLSTVAVELEDRARHLAAGRVLPDALVALQDAAGQLRTRGAPDGAAELLELALELGADPGLVVRAAEHRFDAGDTRAAVRMLEQATTALPPGPPRAEALLLLGEISYKDDSFPEAQVLLERAREEATDDQRLLLMVELRLAFTLYNLGQMDRAVEASQAALARVPRVGDDALEAQALAVSAIVDFSVGRGLDERRLARALELQDPGQRTGAELYPGLIATFLYLWSSRFDEGRAQLDTVCAHYLERGEEQALAWASFTRVWLESGSGDAVSTARAASEAHDRLLLLDTVTGRALALAARAEAAAYAGREQEAREACGASLALFSRSGWTTWSWFPRMTLGALELACGNPEAAMVALDPILVVLEEAGGAYDPAPGGILFAGDAAEALIANGRADQAAEIVDRLEEQGLLLGRPWAVAVGARCRGLLHVGAGDLLEAEASMKRAVAAHDGLAMPVERARTLLALGRVHRAQRQRRAARDVLAEARSILTSVGSPLWRERVDDEVSRLGLAPGDPGELSASEERVAGLAAQGLTNRQVATRLAISQKTVEAHLARAYAKLGIHSRAELGARMSRGAL